jgi:UDP-N-acetyl-D-galactosamine dehydrogenase
VNLGNPGEFTMLELAQQVLIAAVLKRGDLVIYESTVYPGATEEVCVPELEAGSGLKLGVDFGCGYSPERINPGDRKRRLPDIIKVTSGSDTPTAAFVDALYARIVPAGTYKASSIRVAEAAKAVENTQRDVNIALVNELALMFSRMGLSTEEVLAAAGTKWNFLPFRPGLVGGHCIGVDPYYLVHKAQEVGYHPELILAARRINESISAHISAQVMRLMALREISIVGARVLVLGLAFKEDCPDLRNTRVIEIVRDLKACNARVDVHDPWIDPEEAQSEFGLEMTHSPAVASYDAVILCVAHRQFRELGVAGIRAWCKSRAVIYDVKYVLPATEVDGRL